MFGMSFHDRQTITVNLETNLQGNSGLMQAGMNELK
jgi:hypothetical protein